MPRYLAVVAVQTEGRRVFAEGVNQPTDDVLAEAPQIPDGDRLVAISPPYMIASFHPEGGSQAIRDSSARISTARAASLPTWATS